MQTITKLLICAIFSLSIGIAAASPLLVAELKIQPYPFLPEGPKPEVTANLAYASFSVHPADSALTIPDWYHGNETPTAISYNMVLNITNLSDEYVTIDCLQASAAQNYTRGSSPFMTNGVTGTSGSHRYVYLDGELVNVTWIPNSGNVPMPPHPKISGYPEWSSSIPWSVESNATFPVDGYWREGVEISDTYVNGTLTYTYMYINGTWTDVTDRVEIPDREDSFSRMSSGTHAIASGWFNFQGPLPADWTSTNTHTYDNGTTVTTVKPMYPTNIDRTVDNSMPNSEYVTIYTGPGKFNNTWAPYESRLITLNGTVFAFNADVSQYLQNESIAVHIMGQAHLANSLIGGIMTDTSTQIDIIQQIQVQADGNSFVYNDVLGANQMLQSDQWGVEVFIEPVS